MKLTWPKIQLICIVALPLFILNSFAASAVRFESALVNYGFAFALLLLTPLLGLVAAFNLKELWTKVTIALVWAAVFCLLTLPMFLIGINFIDIVTKGIDPSFEFLKEATNQNHRVRFYRTNGGATTAYGIVARVESKILPGLVWTKKIYSEYRQENVDFEWLDEHTIKIFIPADADNPSDREVKVVRLGD